MSWSNLITTSHDMLSSTSYTRKVNSWSSHFITNPILMSSSSPLSLYCLPFLPGQSPFTKTLQPPLTFFFSLFHFCLTPLSTPHRHFHSHEAVSCEAPPPFFFLSLARLNVRVEIMIVMVCSWVEGAVNDIMIVVQLPKAWKQSVSHRNHQRLK